MFSTRVLRRAGGTASAIGQHASHQRVPSLSIIDRRVETYAQQAPLHVAPDYVIEFCESVDQTSLLTYSKYLHKELPVRFARTLKDYQALPYIVGVNPHVEKIHAELSATFKMVIDHPKPVDQASHESWVGLIDERLRIHADTISDLSRGLKEVGYLADPRRADGQSFNHFLNRAFIQRIGRRVLCELLLVLHHKVKHGMTKQPDQIGVFTRVRPRDMIHQVMDQVTYLAETHHERAVDYEVVGDVHAELLCIASHVEYILFELCKNAVLATLDRHPAADPPRIIFRVCEGDAVTVVISDRGGGIPEAKPESHQHIMWTPHGTAPQHQPPPAQAWSYGFSTAPPSQCDDEYYNVNYSPASDTSSRLQLAGFGFGLPLSSVYARFNGGSLRHLSIPGYGTDMHLTIPDARNLRACTSERTTRVGTFEDHLDDGERDEAHRAASAAAASAAHVLEDNLHTPPLRTSAAAGTSRGAAAANL